MIEDLAPDDADRLGEVLAKFDPTMEETYMSERETVAQVSYRQGHEAGVRFATTNGEA